MFQIRIITLAAVWLVAATAAAADRYVIDNDHTSVNFKVAHLGISWVHGRFNDVAGTLVIDSVDPAKSSCEVTIKVESVDTKVSKRDEHLRGPDFFSAKEFPIMTFKSAEVRPVDGQLEVKGTVSLHGKTRPLAFRLAGGKTAEFPPGVHRIGYSTELVLRRSDFGMNFMMGPVGDEIHASISLEAIKQ